MILACVDAIEISFTIEQIAAIKQVLFKLTYVFKKCNLYIEQRFYIYFFAIGIKAKKFGTFRVISGSFFKKVESFKKIMIDCNIIFTIGLRSVEPKADRIHPIMDPCV
jgi:hypothetical protein